MVYESTWNEDMRTCVYVVLLLLKIIEVWVEEINELRWVYHSDSCLLIYKALILQKRVKNGKREN